MNNERWQGPFSNLMMLLFALFLVLYAASRSEVKRLKQDLEDQKIQLSEKLSRNTSPPPSIRDSEAAGVINPEEEVLQMKLSDAVGVLFREAHSNRNKDSPLQDWIEFEPLSQGALLLRILPEGLFKPGSEKVNPEQEPLLRVIGSLIRDTGRKIKIEGHADYEDLEWMQRISPDHSPNELKTWRLSFMRAAWIAEYWVKEFDFDPKKIEIVSWGRFQPLPLQKGEKQRNNRRIEIVIEKKN